MKTFAIFLLWAPIALASSAPPVHDILDPAAIDRSQDACNNFYRFACGGWLKHFKLPADKPNYLRQASVVNDHVDEQLNDLLAKIAAKPNSPTEKKLADYYSTCLDDKASGTAGMSELKARVTQLVAPSGPAALAKLLGELHLSGVDAFFEFFGDCDLKDSSRTIAFLDRGGMSLPDRDYYLSQDSKSREVRRKYKEHIARSLTLVGETAKTARSAADFILRLETELAEKILSKDDVRDVQKKFHPMTYAEIQQLVPTIDWDAYLKAIGIPVPQKWNAGEPVFLAALAKRLPSIKPDELASYLKYKIVHRAAPFVGGFLHKEDFGFWNAYLKGQKAVPPRWKVCTQNVAAEMGEALGQAYVASLPSANGIRAKTIEMVGAIRTAFEDRLKTLDWMDEATRTNAKKKWEKMGSKVGWPEKWRDYSSLSVGRQSLLQNDLAATEFEHRRKLGSIGKPTDRDEWFMLVWEPNAYYAGSNNEIVLPLGVLVPPVFDPRFSEGANFGSLGGGTIGHELTHGFDDSGKDIDGDGNFVTWWSPKSKENFDVKSQCFIAQAEKYEIASDTGLQIRGKATLGENLADNGGVRLALAALKGRLSQRAPAPKLEGFDELQQYFLAYAQGWCEKSSPAKLRDLLLSDFHPPAEFRVNAVLANQPEFAEAFHCEAGSRMAPRNRCAIW